MLRVAPNTDREIVSRLSEKGWLDRLFSGTYLIILDVEDDLQAFVR